MAETRDLLVEIGTEELPPKALLRLSEAFTAGLRNGLEQAQLGFAAMRGYATPRRLAVLVEDLATAQPDRINERRGPALQAAFDEEGNPTKAALGFARSCGVTVDELERTENAKGAWLVFRHQVAGQATTALLPALIAAALAGLPVPKRMRWGTVEDEFVRPVHWAVVLFGDEVVPCRFYGVSAGRQTRGHRFHHPALLPLAEPRAYAPLLESEGRVVADFAERREAVRAQVQEAAAKVGGRAVIDEALLDEVTALVEWPVAVLGHFEETFLGLPAEALIATMKGNQKYFHLMDAEGRLLPHFITIANIESRDPAQVQAGNERVIRPRLADAAFFWDQDRKSTLAARRDGLKHVIFQARLGSLYDKTTRLAALAAIIAESIGGDPALARQGGELAKSDLLTEMVGEFPELQGTMGRYYAQAEGLPAALARALEEQYLPRHAGDALPATPGGRALAIADRLDTLVGIFALGQAPSGDKDPFGLRRAALGTLRIIIEGELDLDLDALLAAAAQAYGDGIPARDVLPQVYEFMMERLRAYYLDSGVRPDTFEAVLARRPSRPRDFDRRLKAVTAFRALPEAASLAAANKRIRNILRQAAEATGDNIDPARLTEPAERRLAEALAALERDVSPLFDAGDYRAALKQLARLREPVDRFFDEVMVMTDDAAVRHNRLSLLQRLSRLFSRAADFSKLQA
ncbi:MAG TPA: glycine--tRNA ligase subunit beta [Gammaproteobacteria bacterium]|nr:glycine--tRNA ligase subunit beta [Gammaproteobacteria bacterium]